MHDKYMQTPCEQCRYAHHGANITLICTPTAHESYIYLGWLFTSGHDTMRTVPVCTPRSVHPHCPRVMHPLGPALITGVSRKHAQDHMRAVVCTCNRSLHHALHVPQQTHASSASLGTPHMQKACIMLQHGITHQAWHCDLHAQTCRAKTCS